MSSGMYSARITPEKRGRRTVVGLGVCLAALGLLSLGMLPVGWSLRAGLWAAWLLLSVVGILRHRRHSALARGYEIGCDGSVRVLTGGGRSFVTRLTAGTTVYPRMAWLRFRSSGRGRWGELVLYPPECDKRLKNKEWRRLQVICRHLSAC